MSQTEKATTFADLHVPGDPLVLYNVWDAATAQAVERAGAKAIASASHAVAEAHGFQDGEDAPLDFVLPILTRIAASTSLPVTMDAEGGYARAPEQVAANMRRYIEAGAVGINFEDSVVGSGNIYSVDEQAARISAIRQMSDEFEFPLFVNARTDVFLRAPQDSDPEQLASEVIKRAEAYEAAGASGLFVPGLRDLELLRKVCVGTVLPVNAYRALDGTPVNDYAEAGVARISHGPGPFSQLMASCKAAAKVVLEGSP